MAAYDHLQAELDKMQHTSMNNTTSVGGPQNQPVKLLVSNNSGNIVQGTSLLANPQHNQLLQFSSLGGQITQAVGKRPSSNQSGPMTKVIIRNTSTGQQQVVPISGNQNLSNTIMVSSPSKTITLSAGSLGSPQKILTTPATPTKQIVPLGKLPITPLKTPPKITMIPVSIGKSPRQGSGQMVTMLGAKSSFAMQGGAITTTATSKPTTITMSPSKVIIKGQPVTMQPGMQQMMNTSLGGATSLVAPRPTGSTMSSSLQPVSVSGSKFQYVRLVTAPTSQQQHSAGGTRPQMQPVNARSIMPSHIPQGNMKIAMQPLQQMQQVKSGNFASQRLILPATTQIPIQPNRPQATLAQIRPASGSTHISQIGGTTSINLQNLQGVQGFTLVPANQVQYVTQVQSQPPAPTIKQENFVQITSSGPPPSSSKSNFNGSTSASSDGTGQRPRKPCNCTKSQCLKLYCDCFANGEFCSNCNCNNCANNLEHEDERSRAIKSCLERNPLAFHPKIGGYKTGKGRGEGDRRHNKGCNCKRSGCLKNYCECYEAKIMCSSLCKCVGCKNFEESPDRKTLMHLADAAEVRVQQQTAAKSKLSSQIADLPPRPAAPAAGERLPFTFVTGDVAEATCACLVAQAEEAERTRQIEMVTERMILEEFGRCLMQVIESANRTKAHSPVP